MILNSNKPKPIPCPCKKDCAERTAVCKLSCKKYEAYDKLKRHRDFEQGAINTYRDLNYVSRNVILKEYYRDKSGSNGVK